MFGLFKGWTGEIAVKSGLARSLDQNIYRAFHNVIVPTTNGTTQIDHLIVSAFGLFVVETKNYKGWIFGSPEDRQWCQSLYGRRFRFQNPLLQNYRHIKCLEEYLGLPNRMMHSVVFFIGDCKFKTSMPPNVLNNGLRSYIESFQRVHLTNLEMESVCRKLTGLHEDKTLTKKAHLHSLNVRHSSTTTCPKCNSSLMHRTAKKGKFAGRGFLGCSAYPRCRFTRDVPAATNGTRSHDSLFERVMRFLRGW